MTNVTALSAKTKKKCKISVLLHCEFCFKFKYVSTIYFMGGLFYIT